MIRRPGPAGAAVLLLAALFLAVAWTASSSTPAPAPLAATPEVLARYAPPALPADLRRRVQAMFDVRSPGAGRLCGGSAGRNASPSS